MYDSSHGTENVYFLLIEIYRIERAFDLKKEYTTRDFITVAVAVIVYIALVYGIEKLGNLLSFGWLIAVPAASFVCAAPVMIVADKFRRFGGYIIFGIIWIVALFAFGMPGNGFGPVLIIAITLFGEIMRRVCGYNSKWSFRFSYCEIGLLPLGQCIYLWTDTRKYIEIASEKMGEAAARQISGFSNAWLLVGIIVVSLILGYIGAMIMTNILKITED